MIPATAQTPVAKAAPDKTSGKKWVPTRTPDGQPDLQGIWNSGTITSFERSPNFAGRAVLTEEEAADMEKRSAQNRNRPAKEGEIGGDNVMFLDTGIKVASTRQTSLVVEPPDGRVPLTPAAEAAQKNNVAHTADSYTFLSPWDRCITRGVPGVMFPGSYNNAYQIIQTPGYVVMMSEMIHEARIIPLNAQHASSNIREWNGDSIGHWEGDTLVVDTTNFNGKSWITTTASTGRIRGVPETADLHLVERFTRTDPGTILYEVTITDPAMYSQAWKVAIPLHREENYQIYEYACHEGNEAVSLILRGGRAD